MLVKLLEKVEKALNEVCQQKGIAKEKAIERIKKNFGSELFTYGLNVKVDRATAGIKNEDEKHKARKRVIENLINGEWHLKATVKSKEQIIKEFLETLPAEVRNIIKEKAGI